MSGGSYNYLYCKELSDLFNNEEDAQAMADRLAELGHADAAKETMQFVLELRRSRNRLESITERLSPVWKAVEWYDSKDWGEEDVIAAVEKYRSGV